MAIKIIFSALALVALLTSCTDAQVSSGSASQCPSPCRQGLTNYAHECINHPSLTCDAKDNQACSSCGVYLRDSVPYVATTSYHITTPGASHSLVVPTHPCSGVENWNGNGCGEATWDAAWDQVLAADRSNKGFAVNSSNRRSQHQLHIHIADTQPSLRSVLYDIANHQDSSAFIDCPPGTSGTHLADNCKYSKTATATSLSARWVPSTGPPSSVQPFTKTYTTSPGPPVTASTGLLVASPKKGGFVLVTVTDRPVECLLQCLTDCQTKCTK